MTQDLHKCKRWGKTDKTDEGKKKDYERYRNIGKKFDQSILYESDNYFLKLAKVKIQDKLTGRVNGVTYAETLLDPKNKDIVEKWREKTVESKD